MKRVLVIPAAGRGSRLGWAGPKVLFPVAGRPMLDHLLSRYGPYVDQTIVVTTPDALAAVQAFIEARGATAACVVQPAPTGMLPAILCARPAVEALSPDEIWITWCDQIGISDSTARRLADEMRADPGAAIVFPTVQQQPPYIHFSRHADGTIRAVLQRREGDRMPETGESDAGLFALRHDTYLEDLSAYDARAVAGTGTAERNFLPFIPWLASRRRVRTFPVRFPEEAIGINTPDDARRLEAYLRGAV